MNQIDLYKEAVMISKDFLGPAGERFIRRQIRTHLAIEPEALQPKHIDELVRWVRLTFAVLTDNAHDVETFSARLRGLAKGQLASQRR